MGEKFGREGKLEGNAYSIRNDPMLLYYLSVLDVRLRWLKSRTAELNITSGSETTASNEIFEEAQKLRDKLENLDTRFETEFQAWTEVYCLERLLGLLEPSNNLLAEIRLRLDEASAERVSAEPRLRTALTKLEADAFDRSSPPQLKQSEEPTLRALLLEILEETHWTKQRKFHSRPIQKEATRRIVLAGVLSFALFLVPYVGIYTDIIFRKPTPPAIFGRGTAELLVGLPFYTALTAGLFGAYFSRLLYIQQNASAMSVGGLKTAREFSSVFLRGIVGMCGALVVFFFLRSGIVQGKLFPDFHVLNVTDAKVLLSEEPAPKLDANQDVVAIRQILPSSSLALLAVWCFLAGFSERLVPSILSTTERTLSDAASGTKK